MSRWRTAPTRGRPVLALVVPLSIGDMSRHLRSTGGMDPFLYHDFAVGDRVQTVDGVSGTVQSVSDGPIGGAESYEVLLDGGVGGGDYSASQLTRIASLRASSSRVASTPADDDEDGAEGYTGRLASDWYPELDEILHERPPLAHSTVLASRRTAKWVVTDEDGEVVFGPVTDSREAKDFAAEIIETDGTAEVRQWSDGGEFTGWANGSDAQVDTSHLSSTPVRIRSRSGFVDRVMDPLMRAVDERFPDQAWNPEGNKSVADWCRFRRDERCYYPKELDHAATAREGYAVWIPHDRGICERGSHAAQKDCPIGAPGPNSGERVRFTDATVPYSDGGQRGGIPTQAATEARRILAHAKASPNFGWHLTSAWADVRAKGKAIRQSGGVTIISVLDDIITAEVRGDTDTYITTLTREPGTTRRAIWDCSCDWNTYAWGRSAPFKHLEGRPCSHLLALSYEVQAQEMYGGTAIEDPSLTSGPSDDLAYAASVRRRPPSRVAAVLSRKPQVKIHRKAAMHKTALPPLAADPTIEEVVDWYINAARSAEPLVSSTIRSAAERFGGAVEGFDNRIKPEDSLRQKINDRWNRPGDRRELLDDALRYTLVFHPSIYSVSVTKAIYLLEEQGMRVVDEENYWTGGPYQGINYVLQTRDGMPFELQFHTDDGYALKDGALHTLYEEFRKASTPLARRQELYDIMSSYWSDVEIPAEVHQMPGLKTHLRPTSMKASLLLPAPIVAVRRAARSRRTAERVTAGFWGNIRGRLEHIVSLLPGGQVLTEGGETHDARDVEYPDYDPVAGLHYTGARVSSDDIDIFSEGELKDEPEPALPSTTADSDEDIFGGLTPDENERAEALYRQAIGSAPGGAPSGPEWLNGGSPTAESKRDASEIASVAKKFLATGERPERPGIQATAVRAFSVAEQQEIINEGESVRAANLSDLQLDGTHYDPITDEDDDLLW